MLWFEDVYKRRIRLTDERQEHIESDHPEMSDQIAKARETLLNPDIIIRSKTDPEAELFYRHYNTTPVTEKYLCVVVKSIIEDLFMITAYFTDSIKRGETLWEKK
jgi:septum formation inhibitor MinC